MPRRRPDKLAAKIGGRISKLRAERGLTREQLAYENSIGKATVSDLERGLVRPSVPMLAKIAKALDVDLVDLVTFPDDGIRHELIDATRRLSTQVIGRLLDAAATGDGTSRR